MESKRFLSKDVQEPVSRGEEMCVCGLFTLEMGEEAKYKEWATKLNEQPRNHCDFRN